jgi:hypothetical protein
MAYSGAWIAAAAAAEEKKRRQALLTAEEETMTGYTQGELEGEWEFKIVRSESRAFRRPEVLNQLIEEEAQAGWVLLEKLDDGRVRFKRPRRARTRDVYLPEGVDPYRTQYDARSSQAVTVLVTIGLLMLTGLGFSAVFAMSLLDGRLPRAPIAWTLVAGVGLVVLMVGFVVVAMVRRGRR